MKGGLGECDIHRTYQRNESGGGVGQQSDEIVRVTVKTGSGGDREASNVTKNDKRQEIWESHDRDQRRKQKTFCVVNKYLKLGPNSDFIYRRKKNA